MAAEINELGVDEAVNAESSWTCLHVDFVCTSSRGGTGGVLGGVWRAWPRCGPYRTLGFSAFALF